MKNKIYIFLVVFIASSQLHAKTGFIGRRNELSMDLFSLANMQEINITYKFALKKHFLIYANYATASFEESMKNVSSVYLSYYEMGNNIANYYGDEYVISGKTNFKTSTIGFGVLYSSPFNNMDLPVGGYTGIGIYKTSGTMVDSYSLKEPALGSNTPLEYEMSQWHLRFLYGKDIVLTGMLTLDLSICAGFSFGKYQFSTPLESGLIADSPYGSYPQNFYDDHNKEEWVEEIDYTGSTLEGSGVFKKVSFYLMPSIRIGYIF